MAGGVCVPLCPSHPLDTLKYYVEDSGAHLTLTTPDMKDKGEINIYIFIYSFVRTKYIKKGIIYSQQHILAE